MASYWTEVEVDPAATPYEEVLDAGQKDGIKVIQTGTTGANGHPVYRFVGGSNQGAMVSALARIGVSPGQYELTELAE